MEKEGEEGGEKDRWDGESYKQTAKAGDTGLPLCWGGGGSKGPQAVLGVNWWQMNGFFRAPNSTWRLPPLLTPQVCTTPKEH